MTNTRCSKISILFLVCTILLALVASNAVAARKTPTDIYDKKKPDCIVDPDGSALIPGLGRVMIPTGHVASTSPDLGDSTPEYSAPYGGYSPLPGSDDTFPPVGP